MIHLAHHCKRRNLRIVLLLLLPVFASAQQNPTRFVDPFIGTGGHGHTFPGASLPFGMVQLSPDTRLTGWDSCSGYHYSDNVIYGFSHTHLSGTGIPDYGDILLMPTVGPVSLEALIDGKPERGYASPFNHKDETARPGYYSVRLHDGGILAEMTATTRVGFHRYTFPESDRGNIIVDLTHRDRVLDSYLRIVDATHIEGFRRSTGWAKDQIVYFVAEFSQPFLAAGIAKDGKISSAKDAQGTNIKAFFTFATQRPNPILIKVALSAVSIDGARRNLFAEAPEWDFDKIKTDADRVWSRELNRIQVQGGTESQRKTFYTALYHAMLTPNVFMDVDGQFRGTDLKIHQARGFTNYTVFSLWDTFRAEHPLFALIDQKRDRDFIKTFLAQYEYGGRLPVWELAANETDTMIGYHAVPVIADAVAKGISGFDRKQALAAMKHSADLRWNGLEAYIKRGYISMEDERESVSKTLEYAYDDWCIAEMAKTLGHTNDYHRFIKRAQFYRNVFDPATGFMRPRRNGGWLTPFDPREVNSNFTEANSWQYTFFVPQDVSGLIELMGGKDNFARKLDEMFKTDSRTTGREQADITGMIGQYAHGNEPSHHMAYLFDYAGQPWKTQQRVRQIMDEFYTAAPDGLIGNEDCGQMSAWYVFSAAGFYPVTPGQASYAIGTPLFPELRFNLENGRSFVIKARGISAKNFYIQSATLNGRPYRRSYLLHRDLMNGGQLVFQMAPRPNPSWGAADVPVSQIVTDTFVPAPIIEAPEQVFRTTTAVSLRSQAPGAQVRFTTDGTDPGLTSQTYLAPFAIDRTTTVKAIAVNQNNEASLTATATFHKLPHDWSIKYLSHYNPQYTAGGDLGLIDGIRGDANFTTGSWQGYQGQDFAAIVDLGKIQDVSRLGAGFLQDVGPWIWMPRRVRFETSIDGQAYTTATVIENELSDKEWRAMIKDLVTSIPTRKARYVRITAENYGRIPDWHPGHGEQAFIFIDEIIIE